MKTGEDFRREFPDVDEGFRDAAHRALLGLHAVKKEKQMKFRPMIVIALALILIMGVGVAATWERWSLDDFITDGRITTTEEEWHEMIDAFEPVTVQMSVAELTVREALFDGYAIYIVVDARPKGESVFFVPERSEMTAPACEVESSLPEDITLQEYTDLKGYTRTFEVSLGTDAGGMTFMPEMKLNVDGTATFYLRQRLQQPKLQTDQVDLTLHVLMRSDAVRYPYTEEVPLTIKQLPVLEEAFSPAGESHEFTDIGVTLTNLHLTRTPLSTYVTADVQVINEEAFGAYFGNYVLRFIGPDGKEYDAGPFNLSGFMRDSMGKDAEPGELYYMATLTMQEIPDTLRLIETPWGVHDPDQATDNWTIQLEHAQ